MPIFAVFCLEVIAALDALKACGGRNTQRAKIIYKTHYSVMPAYGNGRGNLVHQRDHAACPSIYSLYKIAKISLKLRIIHLFAQVPY